MTLEAKRNAHMYGFMGRIMLKGTQLYNTNQLLTHAIFSKLITQGTIVPLDPGARSMGVVLGVLRLSS